MQDAVPFALPEEEWQQGAVRKMVFECAGLMREQWKIIMDNYGIIVGFKGISWFTSLVNVCITLGNNNGQ